MNNDRVTKAEADIPPADPARDQAASGYASKDDGDPASWRHHAAVLDRLGDIGVALAEQLPSLARAQARLAEAVTERLRSTHPEGIAALGELAVMLHRGNVDFAQMYERICRSVRRCIAMQMQVASGLPLRRARNADGGRDAAAARASAAGRTAAEAERSPKPQSEHLAGAESGIAAEFASEFRPERLFDDLYDRPEDPTGTADLGLNRPLQELVAEICADFGVDGRLWAERLGIGEETMAAAAATGKNRRNAGRSAAPGGNPLEPPPGCVGPADPGGSGVPIGAGLTGRNRRERRAALKLARRRSPPVRVQRPDSGHGPP